MTTLNDNRNEDDGKVSWWWILALIVTMLGIVIIGIFMMSYHTSETFTNITVSEKYAYQYHGSGDRIVDEIGNMYFFMNSKLWAKMKVDQTYEVRVVTYSGQYLKYIDAVKINGTWWR